MLLEWGRPPQKEDPEVRAEYWGGGITVTGTEVISGQAIGGSSTTDGDPAPEAAALPKGGGATIVNTGVMCLGGTVTITDSVIGS